MIDAPRRQRRDLRRRRRDASLARHVREADDRVGVRDVEGAADQRHPEWRMQFFEKYGAHISDAIAIGVAQKDDLVRTWHCAASARRKELEEESLDTPIVV